MKIELPVKIIIEKVLFGTSIMMKDFNNQIIASFTSIDYAKSVADTLNANTGEISDELPVITRKPEMSDEQKARVLECISCGCAKCSQEIDNLHKIYEPFEIPLVTALAAIFKQI